MITCQGRDHVVNKRCRRSSHKITREKPERTIWVVGGYDSWPQLHETTTREKKSENGEGEAKKREIVARSTLHGPTLRGPLVQSWITVRSGSPPFWSPHPLGLVWMHLSLDEMELSPTVTLDRMCFLMTLSLDETVAGSICFGTNVRLDETLITHWMNVLFG